jgi:RND superfamily putative drug exporter
MSITDERPVSQHAASGPPDAAAVPDVVDARVVTAPASSGRVVVRVVGSTAVDDSHTATMVNTLRARLGEAVPGARVGGPAAQTRDLTGVLVGRAPYAIGPILLVAFVLLLIVFRSLVVALTSILMNLLTVGAAFGFATLVFQHGFGTGLLGIDHQAFVDAWAPLFFFALLFGLSMDYQLFLLAAIRSATKRPAIRSARSPRALRVRAGRSPTPR